MILGVLIAVTGLLFTDQILKLFGITDALLEMGRAYLSIVVIGAPFLSISMVTNNVMRAEGKAKQAMVIMIIGTGSNIVLDPIFILGLDMGIQGAAIATAASQVLSASFAVSLFLRRISILPIRLSSFRVQYKELTSISALGFSFFIRNA